MQSIFRYIVKFVKKYNADDVGAYAGQASLFIIMSFLPFILMVFNILNLIPGVAQSDVVTMVTGLFPDVFQAQVYPIIEEIYENSSGTALITTIILALWPGSRGFLAIIYGLNNIYGMRESRGYFKVRAMSMLYTLVFVLIILVTMSFLVFSNNIYQLILRFFGNPSGILFEIFDLNVRIIVIAVILVLYFWLLFITVPNHRAHPLRELPGAIVTAGGWIIYTMIYYFYYKNMSNFSLLYGSLAAVVFLMLWLYFSMYILFIGAEINTEINSILELRKQYKRERQLKHEQAEAAAQAAVEAHFGKRE